MDVAVVVEHRFERAPDGSIWTATAFPYEFWARYLDVFDAVRVVARVRDVPAVRPGSRRADGPGASFAAVPHYIGPLRYLLRARAVRRALSAAVGPRDAVILRVASHLANCLEPTLVREGHPFGLEVVSDPRDAFGRGALRHPLRPLLSFWFARRVRAQCTRASVVAYVTEEALQARYPSAPGAGVSGCSDADLPPEAFVAAPRPAARGAGPRRIVLVGSLAQMYKGPDVLLDATAVCVREGVDLSVALVGDGRYRPELEARASALGLEDRVRFAGELPSGAAVRAHLDAADLFVLPSRSEGLPRALVEAMARGLPCIGSRIGGIPELLAAEDLVPPGDARALASKLAEVLADPARLEAMARRNLARAQAFRESALRPRRLGFLSMLRARTREAAECERPRLLMVTTDPSFAQHFLLPFARYFRARGFRVDLMTHGASARPEGLDVFDRVWEVGLSRKPFASPRLMLAPRAIHRIVARERYDLVHVQTPVAAFLTRLALRKRGGRPKIVYSAHGFHFFPGNSPLRNVLYRSLERLAGRWTDYLVVLNRVDREATQRLGLVPEDRCALVPGVGIDTERYSRARVLDTDVARLRAELAVSPDAPLFLIVAELVPQKRHRDALAALATLERTGAHLVCAGEGPLASALRGRARRVGIEHRVHLLGHRHDIPVLLRASTALLLLSEREGLPTCILEALAMEVPVIGTDTRGTHELLEQGRGLLVPVGDVAAQARAMAWVLDHPAESIAMARRGRFLVEDGHDLQTVLARYEEIYAKVLGRLPERALAHGQVVPRTPALSQRPGSPPS